MRDIHVLIIGRGLQAILSIATLRLITTYLDKSEIAQFYLVGSIIFFFSSVLLGAFSTYFNRYLLEDRTRSHALFLRYAIQAFTLGVLSIIFNVIFVTSIIRDLDNVASIITVVFLNVTLSAILRNLLTSINILQSVKFFVFLNTIALALGIMIASLFVQHISSSAACWFLGVSIGEMLVLPFVYYKFRNLCKDGAVKFLSINGQILNKSLINFVAPLMLVNLFVWFQMYAYRLITQTQISAEILSNLVVGIGVAIAIFAVAETVINQYFYPQFLRKIQSSNHLDRVIVWKHVFRSILVIYFSVALFIITCSKSLIVLLTDPKFHDIFLITSLAALIELSRVLNNVFMWIYQSEKLTKLTILPYCLSAIILVTCLQLFEIQISFNYIILSLMLSHISVTIYFILNLKIKYEIKFSELIFENIKYYITLLIVFCLLYSFANLYDYLVFHLVITTVGLLSIIFILYPIVSKK